MDLGDLYLTFIIILLVRKRLGIIHRLPSEGARAASCASACLNALRSGAARAASCASLFFYIYIYIYKKNVKFYFNINKQPEREAFRHAHAAQAPSEGILN